MLVSVLVPIAVADRGPSSDAASSSTASSDASSITAVTNTFTAEFTAGGVSIGGTTLATASIAGTATTAVDPSADGTQTSYDRGNVSEWFATLDRGLEHGWTFSAAPAGFTGALAVAVDVSGAVPVAIDDSAVQLIRESDSVLHYRDLLAFDADGQILPAAMTVAGQTISIEVDASNAVFPVVIDPIITSDQDLLPGELSGGLPGERMATSVAIDGDLMAVSVNASEAVGQTSARVLVFVRAGGEWLFRSEILAPTAGENFGADIAVKGDRIVVGAPLANDGVTPNAGAIYVYDRSSPTSTFFGLDTRLTACSSTPCAPGGHGNNDDWNLGASVDLSAAGTVVVGSSDNGNESWLFTDTLGTWSQAAEITNANADAIAISDSGEYIASTSTINGNTVVARWDGVTLEIGDTIPRSGTSVAIEIDATSTPVVVVGTPVNGLDGQISYSIVTAPDGGGFGGNGPTSSAPVDVTPPGLGSEFGAAVDFDGSSLIVGAPSEGGFAYRFAWNSSTDTLGSGAVALSGSLDDAVGFDVAVDGLDEVVGAPGRTSTTSVYAPAVGTGGVFTIASAGIPSLSEAYFDPFSFGKASAVDGDTLAVGGDGLVRLYTRTGGSWIIDANIASPDFSEGFGAALDVDGDSLIVGDDDLEIIYFFERTAGVWGTTATEFDNPGASGLDFGTVVAIGGDVALAGAPDFYFAGAVAGEVYRYVRSGATWVSAGPLALGQSIGDATGADLSISVNEALIGGNEKVFHVTDLDTTPVLARTFTGPGAFGDQYGRAVTLDGDTLAIGAPNGDAPGGPGDVGTVTIFRRSGPGSTFLFEQLLVSTVLDTDDNFGEYIDLDGNVLAVAETGHDLAHVYGRVGSTWFDVATIDDGETKAGVSVDGNLLVVEHIVGVKSYSVPAFGALTVNSDADASDAAPGDGACETATAGECTLRAAIEESNALGKHTINFDIPGPAPHVIDVSTPLPTIITHSIFDGLTQPDSLGDPFAPDGLSIGIRYIGEDPDVNGLDLNLTGIVSESGSTVRGFAISGFSGSAINVADGEAITIEANRVGVRTQDALPSGNQAGISLGGSQHVISGNLVSNNTNVGIDDLSIASTIELNRIGTNPAGTTALPNGVGINTTDDGTLIRSNLISGNNEWGIQIKNGFTTIESNRIGIGLDDQPLGNALGGIVAQPSGEVAQIFGTIGSTDAVDGNEIAFNGGPGIALVGDVTIGIVGNSIAANVGLGIDIDNDGVTANDPGDGDSGPNERLNTPVIQSVIPDGPDLAVTSDLDVPTGIYLVEYFASDSCDATGFGEGRTFLDSQIVNLTLVVPATVQISLPAAGFGSATNVTSTVTRIDPFDAGFDAVATSEFSNCESILSAAVVDFLSVSVNQGSTGPGISSIPIADIPVEAVLGATSDIDSAPLGAVPLGAVPLGAVDLTQSPLGAVPLGAVPLGAVPLSAVPLGAVPLGAVPVDYDGGWPALLIGTPFEGQLPQAVSLEELLAIAGSLPATHPVNTLPLGAVDLAAAPLGAVSLAALALGAAPLGAVDLDAICDDANSQGVSCSGSESLIALEMAGYDISSAPLGAVPLSAVPLSAVPLGAVPLSAVPLSAVPLGAVPLSAVPLSAVPLGAVPLSAVEIGGIPLSAVPLSAVPLSAVPLSAVEIAGTPLGAVPLSAVSLDGNDGCALIAGSVVDCADAGIDANTTLQDLAIALEANGSSLADSPLGAVPLSAVPLGAVPLSAVPLSAVDLAQIPLSAVPLSAVALGQAPLGAVPLSAVTVGSQRGCDFLTDPGLDCATLGLDADSSLFEVAVLLENSGSSIAASPLGAVPLSAVPLSAVVIDDAGIATLDDLFGQDPDSTIADLPQAFLDELSLADILLAMLVISDYAWEDIDFVALGVQDFVDDAVEITYSATIGVTGSGRIKVEASLPEGYRYRSSSSIFESSPIVDPIVHESNGSQTLTWFIDVTTGSALTLGFDVSPGFALSTSSLTVVASSAGPGVTQVGVAPHTVTAVAPPSVVEADVLYVGHITAPAERDLFDIAPPGPGYTTSVFLSHFSEDTDLVMYQPETAPPAGGGSVTAAKPTTQVIEDDSFAQTLRQSNEPESLGDVPIDPTRGLVEASASRGIADEQTTDYSPDQASYTVQVTGYNGATSADPYVLRVKYRADAVIPSCPARSLGATPNLGSGVLTAGLETIIVFDQGRSEAIHGAAGAATMLASAQTLVDYLNNPSNGFGSAAILFTDGVTNYSSWDANPCDFEAADAIAKDIRAELADYAVANETLRYVTILGDDEVIPFHRQVDATSYANESSYAAEFAGEQNAIYGSLATSRILTDHPYGDPDPIPWLDRFLYLPEIAVGRLLETPTEIAKAVDTFISFDGELDPTSSGLVTGYDFLDDGAQATIAAMEANGIITDTLISETWTDDDLEDAFLTPNGPRYVSANAHYDYYRALPASEQLAGEATYTDQTLFQTSDVEQFLGAGGDLEGTWLFTMGCHSALSVSDISVGSSTQSQDWAQTYGGNGGILTGSTGFAYGDTVTVALTEELIVGLAESLDGSLTLGQAVVNTLQNYYGRAGLYGVYDEKALQEFTTYGLPMYRVNTQGSPAVTPTPPTVTTDPFTSQPSAEITADVAAAAVSSPYGTYYSVDGQTLDIHYRPIQPMTSIDVTVDGLVARGAVITGWTSTDIPVTDVAFSRPIIDDSAREPEIEDYDQVFPSTFAAIAGFERPSTSPGKRTEVRQNLNLIVGQYNGPSGIQRVFDDIDVEVMYVDADDAALLGDDEPAVIEQVQASVDGSTVGFIVDLDDNSTAARVLVLYRSNVPGDPWVEADLVSGSPWSGGGPVNPNATEVEYLVQVVKASGLVSVSSSKGLMHRAKPLPVPAPIPGVTVDISGTKPDVWYTSDVVLTVTGDPVVTVDGAVVSLVNDSYTLTEDGPHVVTITGANGQTESYLIWIDQTPPEILVGTPSTIFQGADAIVDYECRDAGSGATSCSGSVPRGTVIDTSTPGSGSFTVSSQDGAGNQSNASHSYQVIGVPSVSLAVTPSVAALGTSVAASVDIDAPSGTDGTVTSLVIDWGDGSSSSTTPATPTDHVYALPRIYDVTATVVFASGYEAKVRQSVVIYDATGVYIAGNGKIDAPVGSFTLDPSVGGRVDVSFNPKYAGSQNDLKGKLHVKAKDFDFDVKTTGLDWMLVFGASGTVQGWGEAKFDLDDGNGKQERLVGVRITAIDGDEEANDVYDEDLIKVTIWDLETGQTLFQTNRLSVDGKVEVKD